MPKQDIRRDATLGGHELPPELQDRPEQNRGYDEAAHGPEEDRLENPLEESDERRDAEDEDDA